MLATSRSVALIGVDAVPVEVEVDVSPGIPSFTLVGLPDQAVSEARERVRAAIRNSGYPFPAARITVNLAPADLRKEGPMWRPSLWATHIAMRHSSLYRPLDMRGNERGITGNIALSEGEDALNLIPRSREH